MQKSTNLSGSLISQNSTSSSQRYDLKNALIIVTGIKSQLSTVASSRIRQWGGRENRTDHQNSTQLTDSNNLARFIMSNNWSPIWNAPKPMKNR